MAIFASKNRIISCFSVGEAEIMPTERDFLCCRGKAHVLSILRKLISLPMKNEFLRGGFYCNAGVKS